jgi:hypothetical protein
VSFGTQSWANIGRALEEQILSLRDNDPFVTRWIQEAAGADKTPSRALVERVVAAVGKKIKLASGGELSDTAAIYSDGSQRFTVRGALEMGQGSRTWVIYRALKWLGISADIAIAETEPYTTVASFPVHGGRFRHPLVVAHLGGADGDLWIDADVEGPPLPPGRISPELRGRTAMLPGGKLVTVEGTATESVDEVDIRLALDDKGDAKGIVHDPAPRPARAGAHGGLRDGGRDRAPADPPRGGAGLGAVGRRRGGRALVHRGVLGGGAAGHHQDQRLRPPRGQGREGVDARGAGAGAPARRPQHGGHARRHLRDARGAAERALDRHADAVPRAPPHRAAGGARR